MPVPAPSCAASPVSAAGPSPAQVSFIIARSPAYARARRPALNSSRYRPGRRRSSSARSVLQRAPTQSAARGQCWVPLALIPGGPVLRGTPTYSAWGQECPTSACEPVSRAAETASVGSENAGARHRRITYCCCWSRCWGRWRAAAWGGRQVRPAVAAKGRWTQTTQDDGDGGTTASRRRGALHAGLYYYIR